MFLHILMLLAGFAALVKGADLFVDGSADLARLFRIPGLVIGLTIVAMGTSAPELAVSVSAAVEGSNEIALSNVVGSNIFNLLVVLGSCALFHPVPVKRIAVWRDCLVSLAATACLLLGLLLQRQVPLNALMGNLSLQAGTVTRIMGLLLILVFALYMYFLVAKALREPGEDAANYVRPIWQSLLLIVVGAALIVGGGKAVVAGAREIALFWGMSETLVGLTIVAVGTSLPELVTSVVAARKGETGMAIGNVLGSNIFNMMFILGISASIHPVEVIAASLMDLGILIIATMITMYFALSGRRINRMEGSGMLLLYAAYLAYIIIR